MDTRLHHLSLSPAQTRSMPVRLQEYALLSINTTAFGWPGEKLLGGGRGGGGFGSEGGDKSPQVRKSWENF